MAKSLPKRSICFRIILLAILSITACVVASALFRNVALGNDSAGTGAYRQAIIVKSIQIAGSGDSAQVKLLSGDNKGRTVTASIGSVINSLDLAQPVYHPGQHVLVSITPDSSGQLQAVVIDHYRLPFALWVLVGVLFVAVIFAGMRGIGALLGLLMSVIIIGKFIIPGILQGHSPYVTTGLGIMAVSLLGIYTAHGLSRRTSLALAATYITLSLAVGLSALIIHSLHLSGIASENTFFLSNLLPRLDIRGLLLCGTIISLVGILDDITVGQATAVQELQAANPSLSRMELYQRGLRIGREHIASLINTLVLAYVGSSFIFVFFIAATSQYPLLVNLNTELVMEELARSLVGSAALIAAVPISTFLAARYLRVSQPDVPHSRFSVIRWLQLRQGR